MTSVRIKRVKSSRKTKGLDLRALIKHEQLKEARATKRDFEKTTATWQRDVDFIIEETRFGANVYTNDDIYGYVDKGTPPHEIRPKNASVLRFTPGSTAKTRPNVIGSGAGSPGTPPAVFSQVVQHPGTKARRFTQTIQKRSEKRFASNFNHALAKMARKGKA